MAERLLDAGHRLVIFDTNEAAVRPLVARGATLANSALDVANQAEIVMASLPTPDIVRQAIIRPGGAIEGTAHAQFRGPLQHRRHGDAGDFARAWRPRGIPSLDAPVSGGVAGARNGKLTVMASGPRDALRQGAAAAGAIRPGPLRRGEAGAGPDPEAAQQPHVRRGDRHHRRSPGAWA